VSDVTIIEADQALAAEICRVLRRSISEVCGPDYSEDPAALSEWLSNKTPGNVRQWIGDKANYAVVAKLGEAVVGFALLREGEILLNYVVPECLGKGAGHMMLRALERRAMEKGLSELRCMSTITARSFYEREGFELSGEPIYVGEVLSEFPLRKRIGT